MHHVVDLDVTIVIIAPPAGEEGEVHALFKQWLKKKDKQYWRLYLCSLRR